MVTRAIHIEQVEELSTSSFVNALRRFMALRGPVKQFRSDRGTNFVGAVHELGIQEIVTDDANVKDFLLQNQVSWIVNPPHALHMGGTWERMIGLSRRIIDSMLLSVDGTNLTHQILATFLAEVCAIMNSRPLVPVSSDPEAQEVLTPNVLLTQKTEPVVEARLVIDTRDIYSSHWRRVQHLADTFWSRWRKEYLHTLQVRQKWQEDQININENDIVLMKDTQVYRNEWPMAIVERVFSSEDGKVRTVEIAIIRDGNRVKFIRPVTELVVLSSD